MDFRRWARCTGIADDMQLDGTVRICIGTSGIQLEVIWWDLVGEILVNIAGHRDIIRNVVEHRTGRIVRLRCLEAGKWICKGGRLRKMALAWVKIGRVDVLITRRTDG